MNSLVRLTAAGIAMSTLSSQACVASDFKVFSTIGVQGAVEEPFRNSRRQRPSTCRHLGHGSMLVSAVSDGNFQVIILVLLSSIPSTRRAGSRPVLQSHLQVLMSPSRSKPAHAEAGHLHRRSPRDAARRQVHLLHPDPAAGGPQRRLFRNSLDAVGSPTRVDARSRYPPAGWLFRRTFCDGAKFVSPFGRSQSLCRVPSTQIVHPPAQRSLTSSLCCSWDLGKTARIVEAADASVGFLAFTRGLPQLSRQQV